MTSTTASRSSRRSAAARIQPRDVRTLSVESLLWRNTKQDILSPSPQLEAALARLRSYADDHSYTDSRQALFHLERAMRLQIHEWLRQHFAGGETGRSDAAYLGLDPQRTFEVRSARIAFRTSPDGGMIPQMLLSILQRKEVPVDASDPRGPKTLLRAAARLSRISAPAASAIASARTPTARAALQDSRGLPPGPSRHGEPFISVPNH